MGIRINRLSFRKLARESVAILSGGQTSAGLDCYMALVQDTDILILR